MNAYTVECSACRFIAQASTLEDAQKMANYHEETSGHKGPFVWKRPAR